MYMEHYTYIVYVHTYRICAYISYICIHIRYTYLTTYLLNLPVTFMPVGRWKTHHAIPGCVIKNFLQRAGKVMCKSWLLDRL